MAKLLHKNSAECVNSSLDLFGTPATQTSVSNSRYVVHEPVAALGDGAIEIQISGSSDEYIDLANSLLVVRFKITKPDGTDLDADTKVAVINNALHSMFSQVEVTLNGQILTNQDLCYAFKAYINQLLSYSAEAKQSHLQTELWYQDTATQMDTADVANHGFVARQTLSAESKEVEAVGKLLVGFFRQEKYLLSGIPLKIKLIRNSDAFCLHAEDNGTAYKIKLTRLQFHAKCVTVATSVQLAHEKALQLGTAKYAYIKQESRNFSFPAAISAISQNITTGVLPKRLIVAFVKTSAFGGAYAENPFNFKHNNISFFALKRDGVMIPEGGMHLNFTQDHYSQAYLTLFQGTGKLFSDRGITVKRSWYKNGFTLLIFDLTPEEHDDECFDLEKTGDLHIDVKFSTALTHPLTMLCILEYQELLQIDKRRQVVING